jgi:glucose/mannose-6-phosphate isomerase
MYQLIKDFPLQISKAITIGEAATFTVTKQSIHHVIVVGLGGSGIGGNLVAELIADEIKVPIIVNRGYFLPEYAGPNSLIVLSSYSGNTEETLSVANQVVSKGLSAVCVTSGGKLSELALQHKLDLVRIPSGFPPRTCLGYSSIQLLYVLKAHGLIGDSFKQKLEDTVAFLETEQRSIIEDAEFLAGKLSEKIVVLYTEDKYESTALRLKQQINENSKMHCWYNVVPEMNHNELVGWRKQNSNLAVLLLRSEDEHDRNTHRILFKKDVIYKLGDDVFEVDAKGSDTFQKHFYLVHFGDWLSYHLALLQGFDPMEIDVLNSLKSHMSSI